MPEIAVTLSEAEFREITAAAEAAGLEPALYARQVVRAAIRSRVQSRKGWVRMRSIFGESVMPPDAARVVARAVRLAVALGDVPRGARWEFVEFAAADYLAGVQAEVDDRRNHARSSAVC